jgi:hypothetical protein
MRINEMGLARPEIPQLPCGFADRDRTSETAENAKIGLGPAFVSFHLNLVADGIGLQSDGLPGFQASRGGIPFQRKPGSQGKVTNPSIYLVYSFQP